MNYTSTLIYNDRWSDIIEKYGNDTMTLGYHSIITSIFRAYACINDSEREVVFIHAWMYHADILKDVLSEVYLDDFTYMRMLSGSDIQKSCIMARWIHILSEGVVITGSSSRRLGILLCMILLSDSTDVYDTTDRKFNELCRKANNRFILSRNKPFENMLHILQHIEDDIIDVDDFSVRLLESTVCVLGIYILIIILRYDIHVLNCIGKELQYELRSVLHFNI